MKKFLYILPFIALTACALQYDPSSFSSTIYDCSDQDKDAMVMIDNELLSYTLYETIQGAARTSEMETIATNTLSKDDFAKAQKMFIDKAQNHCFGD